MLSALGTGINRARDRTVRELESRVLRGLGDDVLLARTFEDHTLLFPRDDFIGRQILETGEWQRAALDNALGLLAARDALSVGGTFLDVGANIGTHTVYAALSGHFSHGVAIEPAPGNQQVLALNVRVNDLGERTAVVAAACGSEAGTARMIRNQRNSGNASLAIGAMKVKHPGEPFEVPVRRLDDILAEAATGPVGLIWMDVEGFELHVLRGASGLLGAAPPIVFEYSTPAHSPADRAEMADIVFATWSHVYIDRGSWQSLDRAAFDALDAPCDILAHA